MLLNELKKVKSSKKDIRNFGLLIGGILIALGAYKFWKDKEVSSVFYTLLSVGGFLVIFGLILPIVLKPFHKVWMWFSVVLGFIMTKVILTVLFFLILTPLKLFSTLFGKQFLSLKTDKNKESYWEIRESKKYDPVKSEFQF